MSGSQDSYCLIASVGTITCAIPIEHVVETMRPLPIEPLGNLPAFVRGLAIVRGTPMPVVDAAILLGITGGEPARFVVVRIADRRLALAVDRVVEVRRIARAALSAMPPLLRAVESVAAVGAADAGLLVLLEVARTVPPEVWT